MKIPAVAIAAAFAGGILLGQSPWSASRLPHYFVPLMAAVFTVVFLLLGFVFVWRNLLWPAAAASLTSWLVLGVLGACIVQQPLPAEHVLTRLAAQQIPRKVPLRWHGVLRSEPARLPWGYGFELSFTGVDTASGYLPLVGGMRLGFTPRAEGPALPELHAGDQISVLTEAHVPLQFKDPGAFDRRAFLAGQDVHLQATLRATSLIERTGTAGPSVRWWLARLRGGLRGRLDAMFGESTATAGILRAMLLGDRSFVDRAESADFQRTGVFHVLVVAGLHVGALAVFLFWLAKKCRFPRSAETLLVFGGLSAYIAVVEQRAPVLRAGLMTAIILLGAFFYRRLDMLNSAALAALLLLVANPKYVGDTGFQLSFVAMGCIGGLAQPLIQRGVQPYLHALAGWRDVTRDGRHRPALVQFRMDLRDAIFALTSRFGEHHRRLTQDVAAQAARGTLRIAELFVLTFVLQLGMIPTMARDFHRVSLLGPVVNLFAVPLTGLIVPLGFFGLAAGIATPVAGRLVAHPLTWLVLAQGRMVSFFAGVPHGSYRIPGPPTWATALFCVFVVLMMVGLRQERRLPRWLWATLTALLGLIAAIIASYPFSPVLRANELEIAVLDVAQGDSILVVSPKGSTLLIDGGGTFEGFRGSEQHFGPDPGEEAVSAYLWSRGFQKLDTVALTHAHQDHIGGLTAVLQNFRVTRLWVGKETATPAFDRLKEVAARLHVPVEHEKRGPSFLWDGVQVDFLWPESAPEEIAPLAKNNDSLVIRLRYGHRAIFLPGDAEKQVEYTMLAENDPGFLHSDVLKVGHHGSKNSTVPQFLAAVAPQIAVISAGEENPYGHPSPELLERLKGSVARILRTDRDGLVQIYTDGQRLKVNCFVACPEASTDNGGVHPPEQGHSAQQEQK